MMDAANSSSGESLLSSKPFVVPQTIHPLHPSNIFDVEGLVVVVTGGGTGKSFGSSAALRHQLLMIS
jgi:hypothetical protein